MEEIKTKLCNHCKEQKNLNFFGKDKNRKDGHNKTCKECRRKLNKDPNKKEHKRKYDKEYNKKLEVIERKTEQCKNYQQTLKYIEYQRNYRQNPKNKQIRKKYDQTPERKKYHKEYRQRLKVKEKHKERKRSPKYMKKQREYERTYYTKIERRLKLLLRSSNKRANLKKILFDIDLPWLLEQWNKQEGKCLITNILFDLNPPKNGNTRNPYAPSIDRIDNSKGYTKDNVRLIINQLNISKNEWTDNELYEMCLAVINNNRK